jgi:hypothetical protein
MIGEKFIRAVRGSQGAHQRDDRDGVVSRLQDCPARIPE